MHASRIQAASQRAHRMRPRRFAACRPPPAGGPFDKTQPPDAPPAAPSAPVVGGEDGPDAGAHKPGLRAAGRVASIGRIQESGAASTSPACERLAWRGWAGRRSCPGVHCAPASGDAGRKATDPRRDASAQSAAAPMRFARRGTRARPLVPANRRRSLHKVRYRGLCAAPRPELLSTRSLPCIGRPIIVRGAASRACLSAPRADSRQHRN